MTATDRPAIDLTDVDLFLRSEHHEVFAGLRDQDSLYWNPLGDGSGFWALTRYDEVAAAYADHGTFSSAAGAMLGGSLRHELDTAAGRMLVASDPPRHRLLRHQMHAIFSPNVIDRVTRQVEKLVTRAFDRMLADGGGDYAEDIALQLPVGAVMAMLDVAPADAVHLIRLTRRMIGYRDPFHADLETDERTRLASTQRDIFDFFYDLLDDRRGGDGDDIVSLLLRARVNGRPLHEEDVLYNCMNVAVGGNETSSYSACAGVGALMEHPAQYDQFLSSAPAGEPLIDEVLRWSSTNAYVQRIALRETTVRGQLIQVGDIVTLWNVSANRDPLRFTDPEKFDIHRAGNHHLTFGNGVHRCIGAALGRAELRAVFDEMARRRIWLKPAGAVVRLRSNFILGTTRMPVAL